MVVSFRRRVRALHSSRLRPGALSPWSSPLEDVTTSITIVPSAKMKVQKMFKITTRRSDESNGVFLSIPILCVNNVLPAGSLVFSIVKEGRLEEFMTLLRDGGASIRDHDEYGASLLHVGTYLFTGQCHVVFYANSLRQVRNGAASYVSASDRMGRRCGLCREHSWSPRSFRQLHVCWRSVHPDGLSVPRDTS